MSTDTTTSPPAASSHTHAFQAEVKQLLHLVAHSLYSNRDIFLRELVSNASDACDKLRYLAIDDAALWEGQSDLRIRLDFDPQARTITVSDNGIGLSMQDAIDHLGTIAKSGTREFMQQIGDARKADANLIGQFGVGFYSGFIVADRITVESRRAGLPVEQGVRWSSDGTGEFSVEHIRREARGTDVILHLREDADEQQFGDLLTAWKLKSIINRYSDHISLPIEMRKREWDKDKAAEVVREDWEQVNKAAALWARPRGELTSEQYIDFYKQIAHDAEAPLAWTHNRVEGRSEYTQLLYIPAKAPFDLWNREQMAGVKLYVKRVFILDDATSLLPTYLRFVRGVVDSSDLPLNVSRELLQESRDIRAIREGCTKRVLSLLEDLAGSEDQAQRDKYATFWQEFGQVLKEGIGEDFANRERLAKLLRFASTAAESDAQTTSLADYVARMKPEQTAIYYITADTPRAARSSPQLEVFKRKGVEVLLLTDRVDEWMLGSLREFEGKPLQSVARGAASLDALQDEAEKKQAEEAAQTHQALLARMKTALDGMAQDVRISARLVESPACLVAAEGDVSGHLARLLRQAGQEAPKSKPILEINPAHALVQRLQSELDKGDAAQAEAFDDLSRILFDQAQLAEGGMPEDPAAYVRRVNQWLVRAA
ncbi:MAG: molecular chaperone HtpG [Betaproteobacteria bacterium]|jgi:molecular chaperone HtpG|uniref:molecular chaperone HtpG n=1 Tax=Thiomonas sp. TaxID=2047785 RepID=UPI000BDDE2D8|nr:molecular chaperone HtpG [Thiomonas sp.]MDE2128173.1 molecular chaperone HtpG [Betaproteobacteria bacterium]OZB43891.1 MAG: molecular chaperone HtpG [Thiomonas sp. 15-66-11]OZB65940.1 MAG: molecular chaperone HtpG [Thiomonas sp. 13-66-29]